MPAITLLELESFDKSQQKANFKTERERGMRDGGNDEASEMQGTIHECAAHWHGAFPR